MQNNASIKNETEYATLYEEMLSKCAPQLFIDREEFDKALVANEITAALYRGRETFAVPDEAVPQELCALRTRAMQELGVHFSAKRLKQKMESALRLPPRRSTDAPYDAEMAALCITLRQQVYENKDDVEALESIMASEEYETYQAFLAKTALEKKRKSDEDAAQVIRMREEERQQRRRRKNRRTRKLVVISAVCTALFVLIVILGTLIIMN